jgi:peroxiredoxin
MKKLLIVVSITLAVFAVGCESKEEPLSKNKFDFSLNDLDGRQVRLSDFSGKVVLLEFWATWCPPCRMAIPDLNDINARFKDRDFAILAVSIGEKIETVRDFADEFGITFTVLIDDNDVNSRFGVMTIPTTFIIDKNGNIASKHLGFVPGLADVLSEEIEGLL